MSGGGTDTPAAVLRPVRAGPPMAPEQQLAVLGAMLRRAGVVVREEPGFPTAYSCLTATGYEIALGDMWRRADAAARVAILSHELMHILRGDCLPSAQALRPIREIAAVAEDACINTPEMLAAVKRATGVDGILYEDLRDGPDDAELPATYVPGPTHIYRVLKSRARIIKVQTCGGARLAGGVGQSEAERRHAATVLTLRPETDEERDALAGTVLPGMRDATAGRALARVWGPMPAAQISAAIEAVHGAALKGERRPRRTWAREGRRPEMRGVARLPRAYIMLALDVSGSMTEWYGKVAALADRLAARHRLEVWTFDTAARRCGRKLPAAVEWGGGTHFRPVLRAAELAAPDALIMVTDGDAGDMWTPPTGVPVVWVCVDGGEAQIRARDVDRVVVWGQA